MRKLRRITAFFILNILFLLQGCSSIFGGSDSVDADANLRVPRGNIKLEKEKTQGKEDSNKKAPTKEFGGDRQAYQRYKANKPVTLEEFDKTKRQPRLNIKELNTAMDNAHSSKKVEKPIEVNANSNLKEVINHNKQQRTQKEDKSSDKEFNQEQKKEVVVSPVVKAPAPVPTPAVKADTAVKTPVAVKKDVPAPAPAVKAAAAAKTPDPITAPVQKDKIQIPADIKAEIPAAPVDMSKMSQAELEKLLKSKFKDNNSNGYIDKLEKDASSTKTSTKTSKKKSKDKTSDGSSAAAPAVSKLLTFNESTKLGRINTLLIDCYYTLKNKVVSKLTME